MSHTALFQVGTATDFQDSRMSFLRRPAAWSATCKDATDMHVHAVDNLELDADEPDIPFNRGTGLGRLLIAADNAAIRVQPPAAQVLS